MKKSCGKKVTSEKKRGRKKVTIEKKKLWEK